MRPSTSSVESRCFGLNFDQWRGEFGEDIDRHVADLPGSHDEQDKGQKYEKMPELQAGLNDPTQHRLPT